MILKGSQRANGSDLAVHLMNSFDNERVEIAEVYGTVAGDLLGAFSEFEAISQGTRAKDYLYSLSINPPAPITREQYFEAIQDIETGIGLTNQPRTVVFHVKNGREHAHVVWSRINTEKMQAIPMAFDHRKLMDLACKLAKKYGLSLPPGLRNWEEKATEDRKHRRKEKLEPTLAENAQIQKTGITPSQRRKELTELYESADSGTAFCAALEEKGYALAQGDQRGFVVVDKYGDAHSLSRYIKGHSAKKISKTLAPLTPADLPTVDEARDLARSRAQAVDDRKREQEAKTNEQLHVRMQAELSKKQAQRRHPLNGREQELLVRQASERMALHTAQKAESGGLVFRVRSAVAELIGRKPALRSVLGPIQKKLHLDPKERHALERDALAKRHKRERQDIEREKRLLRLVEKREQQSLERTVKRQVRQAQKAELDLKQAFADAARDQQVRGKQNGDTDGGETINESNEHARAPERKRKQDEKKLRKKSWKKRYAQKSRKRTRKSGKGFGYRRDDDKDFDPGR